MLSKGELQMFATAIVWGLAKTSGRPLPFIIDTPLARLDEEHRANLINFLLKKNNKFSVINFQSFKFHKKI
jgi:DNA sulfur modification protein DndD